VELKDRRNIMKDILKRIKDLIVKTISIKGTIWIMATVLMFFDIIESYIWFAICILFVSVRMFEKLITKFLDKK
jgi:hypothetical protein